MLQFKNLPPPTLSPEKRYQRRLAWRNERTMYKRKCDLTKKDIIAIYPKDSPFPVYSPKAWYSDKWDPCKYGQDFDFNKPFFDQFYELQQKVPKVANTLSNTVNCDYCNIVGDSKNCYLLFGSVECEDCMYGSPFRCKNCIDILVSRNSQFCYECVDCEKLYECFYCQSCSNSRNLEFCFNVDGSQNCFLCVGLRKAKFFILNKKYSKEDYEKEIKKLRKKDPEKLQKELQKLKTKTPVKYMEGYNNENVTGDYVINSKNCYYLFNSSNCEDVNYSTQIMDCHNMADCDYCEKASFNYEISGSYTSSNLRFCQWCWEVSDLTYCSTCTLNTKNCFGCISLKHKQYCILNKQYSKEEYEKLVPKIIKHMTKLKEWGEFFPIKNSPFGYNETVAQEYFPLTKDEALKKGYNWRDEEEKAGKLFRITQKEQEFYKKYNLPIPKLHPDERHRRRMALRNPRKLWDRKCAKCNVDIKTTYSPENPQIVYCEKCYLKEVY